MSVKYKAVIFDLDGTLLDTLSDIANAVNATLAFFGFPERTESEIRSFIGNGTRVLLEKALPENTDLPDGFMEYYADYYNRHSEIKTHPYNGIPQLLKALRDIGMKIAVLSNKLDPTVKKLSADCLEGLTDLAYGQRDGIRRKPYPDGIELILDELCVSKNEAVYVGDSDVDFLTSSNAGLPCILVSWGFCDTVRDLDADIADTAEQLEELLVKG